MILMKNIMAKRDFNVISQNFKEGDFTLQTISELIVEIRHHRKELTKDEAKLLLDIPVSVLENDVELINPKKWVMDNGIYFAGNITWVETKYLKQIKAKFSSCKFELKDIIELTKCVRDEFEELQSASDFLLRNAEVTLRDDVKIIPCSNFNKSGEIFAKYIDKAISL